MNLKYCARCGKQLENLKRKFCNDSCKYWYNTIKKDNERDLAPIMKRNDKWFYMVIGSKWAKSKGQGKRVGGMVKGSMAAMVNCTVESLVEITPENLTRHFAGIPGYYPTYIRLGTQEHIPKDEIFQRFGIIIQ